MLNPFNSPTPNRLLRLAVIMAASLLGCLLYVALIGFSIDASGLRDRTARLLSESLGREVHIVDSLQIKVSAHPNLVVHGLHIANAAGFPGTDFASLGEARLTLDLWPLLRLHLQVEELSGSDVQFHLRVNARGDGNWTFNPQAQTDDVENAPATKKAGSLEVAKLLARLDIKRVSLERLDVDFVDAKAKRHFFELQSLVAQLPIGQPLTLTLHGTVEKTYPYGLFFTGGTLADLARLQRPWPIDLKLHFLSSRLAMNGSASASTGAINFDIGTEDLGEFERLLQMTLPPVGDAAIAGVITYSPGRLALGKISGHMGKTTLNGSLDFNYGGARPSVQGELALPVLDSRPFITGQAAAKTDSPQTLPKLYRELAKATFSLKELNNADADLTLNVGQWLSLPGSVHDAILQVKLDHGRLTVPLQATVADVALSGSASADASATPARFDLALGTHDSSLGNLAALLVGIPDIRGTLSRFNLHVSARGDRGSELMESLDVRLDVEHGKMTYGNRSNGRSVQFSLDNLAVALPAGKASHGEAHGSLLDTSFHASLHGGSLSDFMKEAPVPINFDMQAGSARAQIQAQLKPFAQDSGSDITFTLSAPHSGEIADWFGLKPGIDAPINLHGIFHADRDRWHLADFALQLGRSDLSADVLRTFDQDKALIKLQLNCELLDVDEIQSLLPQKNADTAKTTPAAANLIDIPILPMGINLADSDIVVRIKRVSNSSPFAVRDLRFDGHIRDGMMNASPFAANVADTDFSGAILLDLRTKEPRSALSLSADRLDIGRILNQLGIARNIDAGIDHLRLQLDLHSSRLGQLLAQSELAVEFEGGHLTLRDANTGAKMLIALDRGELKSSAGTAVHLDLLGTLDQTPISIGLQTAKAVDLIDPALPIPFDFSARASGASIKLSGEIDRPFSEKDIDFALDIDGNRLDTLNTLAHTSLPPWGPWSASGRFRTSRSGYEVSALLLQIGSSRLAGHGKLDTTVVPPRIDVDLTAPTIQLDDFRFGDWTPEKPSSNTGAKQESLGELREKAALEGDQVQHILSSEVLRRQNAYLTVGVDQVISGKDVLGNGKLEAKLDNGHIVIGPIVVNMPGGTATLRLGYKPGDKRVGASLRVLVNHFDYGVLARHIERTNEMRGIFSLDVDVSAHAQNISDLWRNGKGHIDFAIWPQNLKSGLLDMWAVNILMSLLPAVDSSNASKVNCAIGRFVLSDGKLSEKTILIDTSRMRVRGKGGVDFATEDVQLYVQPRAKTPQFLSFALPIELNGNFNDFHVGVRPADVLETFIQLATSVVTVPMQTLFGKETPSDGHDVCAVEFK